METIIHPSIELWQKEIQSSERMKELLEQRLYYLGTNNATKNEYEKNEAEILKMKTEMQIEQLNKVIFDRKENFKESFGRYIEELEFELTQTK